MLTLHTNLHSTYARRIEIAIREKGLHVERVEVDMAHRAHRSQPYLSLNPYGRVPTLLDGDLVLPESTVILEYLEQKFPSPALLPEDPQDRARVSLHMKLCDIEFANPNYTTIFSRRFVPEAKWRLDEMERAKKPTARHLGILDRQLEGNDFLVGGQFTLAEVCYMPFLQFIDLLGVDVPPNVRRWADALLARDSATATVPPR